MPNTIRPSRFLHRCHRQADGVALVVTLSMLAIVALLAVAFVLTARTEVKSGTAYNDQAAAKSLAKMAVDRAIMEIVRENKGDIVSGGEPTGFITADSYILVYSTNDFTKVDNWTNDLYLINQINPSTHTMSTIPYGSPPGFDFVELDGQTGRSTLEPYWISVRTTDGILVGRFAYAGMGGLVDLNAIGNIAGKKVGGFGSYIRPADTNFGYGYLGKLSTNNTVTSEKDYTRGICADISLQKFLLKLGYNKDTVNTSAWCILNYRYGWGGGSFPGSQKRPGQDGVDNNNDGIANNPSEYAVYPNLVSDDNALSALSEIWTIPIDGAVGWDLSGPTFGTYDPAYTNLSDYASTGPSADPNIISPYVGTRVNLNAMTNGTAAIVANSVMQLTNVLMRFPQFTNNSIQVALNLIDFHTTNRYPTTFVSGTRTYAGIKPTPYINQILIRYDTTFYRSTNVGGAINKTNYWFRTSVSVTNEIWNPYPGTFPDTNNLVVTNVAVIFTNTTAAQPVRVGWKVSCLFSSPASGFTTNGISPSINTNVYYSTALGFTNMLSTGYYSNWPTAAAVPGNIIISNIFMQATLCGSNSVSETNLIQQITTPVTNVLAIPWPAYANWNTAPWLAGGAGKTNSTAVTSTIISLEADDPRLGILYNQTLGGPTYTLGSMNVNTCVPTNGGVSIVALSAALDTGYREGTNSFLTMTNLVISGYITNLPWITIGDIGYVHRGEPWATIRLQPYILPASPFTLYPYGDGGLLDYFRVSDLLDVAGRININVGLDGPLGANQSPALFALFSGITNPAYATVDRSIDGSYGDSKITAIIKELGAYRATLTNNLGGVTTTSLNGTNGMFTYIGQICAITNLITDLSNNPIPVTTDANREALIRAVANLITTWQGGGTSQILGWGQVVKGGDTTKSNGVPGQVVKIMATFQNVGGKIRITSYQYIP